MIKLKYQDFMAFNFMQAMGKLAQAQLPVKTAYSVKKIVDKMNQARERIKAEFLAMVKEGGYAELDEKGEMKLLENGSIKFQDGKLEAFQAAEKTFGQKEVEIDRYPLHVEELLSVQFSAAELTVLGPVVTEAYNQPVADNVVPMNA